MTEPFDKLIHADEFKLRILLTNTCNRSCAFCLNDFQPKPKGNIPVQFLNSAHALHAITAYKNICTDHPKQIYFSGGEPTLHRDVAVLAYAARIAGARVTLNSNGSFSEELKNQLRWSVDCFHFGVYEKYAALARMIGHVHGTVQCVYSTRYTYVDLDFLRFYLNRGLPVKVFGDLYEDPAMYEAFAKLAVTTFPDAKLSFRFIGVQENRGVGCYNCDRYCVTLKGAWVFPDGGVSHCPQRCQGQVYYPETVEDWELALLKIQGLHRRVTPDDEVE